MNLNRKQSANGFSLVELLAVVLILAVLAAVAVPLYLNTRRTSAARACKANINAIASAEAAVALRSGKYVDMTTLSSTGPESLSAATKCPLAGDTYLFGATAASATSDYTFTGATGGTTVMYIICSKASEHYADLGGSGNTTVLATDWTRQMNAITAETTP